jgi:hypothetical protein
LSGVCSFAYDLLATTHEGRRMTAPLHPPGQVAKVTIDWDARHFSVQLPEAGGDPLVARFCHDDAQARTVIAISRAPEGPSSPSQRQP